MPTVTETRASSDMPYVALRRYEDAAGPIAIRRVSWSSIFAGTALGLVCQLWLSMLGVAIGATAIDPLQEANPFSGLGAGSLVWLAVTILVASFIGGWTTGRLAGIPRVMESALHGALSWASANIVIYVLLGGVLGAAVAGTAKVADRAAQITAQAAPAVPQDVGAPGTVDEVQRQAQQFINQGQAALQSGQAQQQARQVGDRASQAVAGTSWGLVIVMFLGLCAGVWGAIWGAPKANFYARP